MKLNWEKNIWWFSYGWDDSFPKYLFIKWNQASVWIGIWSYYIGWWRN